LPRWSGTIKDLRVVARGRLSRVSDMGIYRAGGHAYFPPRRTEQRLAAPQ
jgi:hypothetical protein